MQMMVTRTDVSPYLGADFIQREKEVVESLGLSYHHGKIPEQGLWALISNTHTKIVHITDEQRSRLKLIIHPNSGYDNFPMDWVKKASFPIIVGNSIRSHAVTNYILVGLQKHYSPYSHQEHWQDSRLWERSLLSEKNGLIIGLGHIGKLVEASLRPLVKSLQIYDPYQEHSEYCLEKVDFVVLCSSLNPSSQKIINNEFLKQLPHDFLIINPARGGLIDQKELLAFLKKRPNAHAILDVFENEPFNSREFEGIPNLTRTSHIAGVFSNLKIEMLNFTKKTLEDYLENNGFENKYKKLLLQGRIRGDFLI